MIADTDTVRALGAAHAVQADALTTVAAQLSSLPTGPEALGPVGVRFLAALAAAAADASRAAAALRDQLATATTVTSAAAEAYEDSDRHAGARILDA
jgi:hypothetical protein